MSENVSFNEDLLSRNNFVQTLIYCWKLYRFNGGVIFCNCKEIIDCSSNESLLISDPRGLIVHTVSEVLGKPLLFS